MLVPPESSSAVLVMMRSKSVYLLDWTTVAETARVSWNPYSLRVLELALSV